MAEPAATGAAAGPAGGFSPAALAKAYSVNPDRTTSQVVAVVVAFHNPNLRSDLAQFDTTYGIASESATSLRVVTQRGDTASFPAARDDWAGEESLDVQAIRGLCHRCKILVVEADSDADTDLSAAVDEAVTLGATVVNNSYGEPEPAATLDPAVRTSYDHPGVVVVAGSGDDGYLSWDVSNSGQRAPSSPMWPASLATVVAVGGTTLQLTSSSTRSSETVWNENGDDDLIGSMLGMPFGATGGGCSNQVTAPRWQMATSGWRETGCGTKRLSADVAAVADPFTGFDVYNSFHSTGWQVTGGTSLASPILAALWGLAGGARGVRYPALSLYAHAASPSSSSSSLFDVVTGSNAYCGLDSASGCVAYLGQSPNTLGLGVLDCSFARNSAAPSSGTRACRAGTGYDGPSGVGVPRGLGAFAPVSPVAALAAPTTASAGAATAFDATASSDPLPGGTITVYRWSWGDGTTSTGRLASHTWSTPGTYAVQLTVVDSYGASATMRVALIVR